MSVDPLGLLFHRSPWRVLDKILFLEPRVRLVARSIAPIPESFPVTSGAFVLEAMGQAGLALLLCGLESSTVGGVVARIRGYNWLHQLPKETRESGLVVEAKIGRIWNSGFSLVYSSVKSACGQMPLNNSTEILYRIFRTHQNPGLATGNLLQHHAFKSQGSW
jgi:hypothetical protein